MPRLERPGVSLHVQRLGTSGPPLVLLHGLVVGSLATWFFTAAPALAAGHRVTLFDLRGHGLSSRPATGYDLGTLADDLAAIVADGPSPGPVTLIGHSYGALVALRYALREPGQVARLVLIEPPLPPSRLGELQTFLSGDPLAGLPAPLQTALVGGGRRAQRFLAQLHGLAATSLPADLQAEPDVADEALAALRVPTTLVFGEQSSLRPVGERLARLWPHASLVTLPGGHFLPVERPAELTLALLEACGG